VTDEAGRQRGLLLPAIEGVETVSQQVAIAARKAGLRPAAALKLYRFRVRRFSEQPETA
jgi:AMMECR1 domain-containing protein